ncbi:MAG: DHHA1 domain-containing protein [Lachnospiraceae bacterium]|nr:DHHA1 domain-containing protein [Lachnospiraceae bacterium]MDD7026939.1 DHHA1 domain-containing protein [Lachnospiraceae bacterium]MDY5700661.1 DHHA1 domain-containing protein [Lachnospiraceae bacterium]
MEETVRLFDRDGYATEFEARVLSCEGREEKFEIVLDQTLFFPEAGGQSPDRGRLNEAEVLDVQIRNGIIYHMTDCPLMAGQRVRGEICWEHRFFNMQQHSGEHIFSGVVHRRFGLNNVGFHLSNQIVTMDFDGPLTEEQLDAVEWEVNQAIAEDIEVRVSYPTKEELQILDYRSKIEIEGQIRIITVGDYDVCACCAPHVRRTGEIGLLKVMSVQRHKGGIRVSILCGLRALKAFREKNRIVAALTSSLSTNQEAIPGQVEKLKDRVCSLKVQLAEAKQKLLAYRLTDVPEDEKNVLLFEAQLETPVVRNAVNDLMEKHPGLCGIFVKKEEGGYQFILGSKNVDCQEIALLLREKLGARGGGSRTMIQGSVEAEEEKINILLKNYSCPV